MPLLSTFESPYKKTLGDINITPQSIYSVPEYTVISETDETVFVEDETGAPHVFTRDEWAKMQGTGGAGLLAVLGIGALLLLI